MFKVKGGGRGGTYGCTSCRALVSIGSTFLAMLPEPPRPVVTIEVLRVGVARSWGWILGDLVLSTMLPAPPRPLLAKCPPPPIVSEQWVLFGRCP